jgi:rhamnogalacturonyl hydrolase YesR
MIKLFFFSLGIVIPQLIIVSATSAQSKIWGERMAETVMMNHPDSLVVKKYVTHGPSQEKVEVRDDGPANWNYEIGLVLKGFDILYQQTGKKIYLQYMKNIIDHFVLNDGSIRTYDLLEYNIDHITPGTIVLSLYNQTNEERYKKAAALLREQLKWHPRTKEGGFWHKHRYPYQMWLDGLYMGEPFYAQYSSMFNETGNYDDIINQFVWMEKHARDDKTGLLYHAWDESKKQRWADPATGKSPEFWSRGMGWCAMAIVDVLDYIPQTYPRRSELILILQRLSIALQKYQDKKSGVWYQIIDKPDEKGNYLEASASCMFVYSIAKGVRKGYLDKSFQKTATTGFEGILNSFIQKDDKGFIHLTKTCSGAGLGGTPYRDGSFDYYIKEPLRTDDLKGIGPFILASIELELLKK